MPSQKNIQLLEEIKEKLEKSQATFFVNYQGLTHQQLEEARRELRDSASEIAVTKNTLMNIALQDKKIDVKDRLQGPYATLFSYEDPVKTAKILHTFHKKYSLPEIKFGIFNGEVVESDVVIKLASLPSREILLGKLVGLMKSPINNFVYTLNGNVQKLVLTLKAIEGTKGGAN